MGVRRVQVKFERDSALPEDQVVNTFHFGPATSFVDAGLAAFRFFTQGTPSVSSFFSNFLEGATNKCQIKVYDLSDAKPRPIRDLSTFTLSSPGSTVSYPAEVCAVMSFYAERNLPRQRGRVYLGPLNGGALAARTADMGVSTTFRDAVKREALAMIADVNSTWVTYSELEAAAQGAEYAGRVVTNGWMDDAVDIQRRRGRKAESRTTW